jgi:hypothetical protein
MCFYNLREETSEVTRAHVLETERKGEHRNLRSIMTLRPRCLIHIISYKESFI